MITLFDVFEWVLGQAIGGALIISLGLSLLNFFRLTKFRKENDKNFHNAVMILSLMVFGISVYILGEVSKGLGTGFPVAISILLGLEVVVLALLMFIHNLAYKAVDSGYAVQMRAYGLLISVWLIAEVSLVLEWAGVFNYLRS